MHAGRAGLMNKYRETSEPALLTGCAAHRNGTTVEQDKQCTVCPEDTHNGQNNDRQGLLSVHKLFLHVGSHSG